jgi:hypothetical protein
LISGYKSYSEAKGCEERKMQALSLCVIEKGFLEREIKESFQSCGKERLF